MSLPATAPGFDTPIAVLKHCHDRIRKQLATLDKLLAHLPAHGADEQARQAAAAVLKYFDQAAPLHHADEEENLIPMLQACAEGEDAATLAALGPGILQDHDAMDAMWQDLHEQLRGIAAGSAARLDPALVASFGERYLRHMETEEGHIAPMAKRLFSARQMAALGQAMQARRGVAASAGGIAGVTATADANTGVKASADSAAAPATGDTVHALRKDYGRASLNEDAVADDPIVQFASWFEQAQQAKVNEPNAMSVATVDADGKPTSRIVLIKQFDARGFTWYTNYDSQKGRQLAHNPHAALLFFWPELERQVRIEGRVERTAADESDTYFHSRPLKSRLAAIASAQSAPIANRTELEQNYHAVEQQYGEAPPRPAHWGGFRLVPERIEFWQGRRSRFHDRIVYLLQADGSWARQRLQP
ncbi:MAG: pyridoxamine 5'-phosphate oxidase [Massilia sp.]